MPITKLKTVDLYIKKFPKETQTILKQLKAVLKKELPKATLEITYGIPTFKQNGRYVIYFSGFTKHISLYPTPNADKALMRQLKPYLYGAGTIRFELDQRIPYTLVRKAARVLLKMNQARTK